MRKIEIIMALIGISILSLNFIMYNALTEREILIKGEIVSEKRPLKVSFTVSGDQDVHVKISFSRFDAYSLISIRVNEREIKRVFNISSYDLFLKNEELKGINSLELEEVSGLGGVVIVKSIEMEKVSRIVKVLFFIINLFSLIVIFSPYMMRKYREFKEKDEIEIKFPEFLRDVVEGLKAGMSLTKAILSTRNNNYGSLNKYLKGVYSKIEWGIPFDKIMKDFAEEVNSIYIKRGVNSIIQAHVSGGKISDVLDAIRVNLMEIKNLEKERRNEMYGEVLTGYSIYVVFILVLISLLNYLFPALTSSFEVTVFPNQTNPKLLVENFKVLFRDLALIQAVFSGLIIGKLSEGSFKSGGKHVLILAVIGYSLLTFLV